MSGKHSWTYRPGSAVVRFHRDGGVWREVQPYRPAWSWLGATPHKTQQHRER